MSDEGLEGAQEDVCDNEGNTKTLQRSSEGNESKGRFRIDRVGGGDQDEEMGAGGFCFEDVYFFDFTISLDSFTDHCSCHPLNMPSNFKQMKPFTTTVCTST